MAVHGLAVTMRPSIVATASRCLLPMSARDEGLDECQPEVKLGLANEAVDKVVVVSSADRAVRQVKLVRLGLAETQRTTWAGRNVRWAVWGVVRRFPWSQE